MIEVEMRINHKRGVYSTQVIDPHGFFVYLLWGDDETCPIYVGQSINVMNRISAHMADPVKGPRLRYVTLERCESREQMVWLERALIRQYLPEFNLVRYEDAA
jgi:hypothetical protein